MALYYVLKYFSRTDFILFIYLPHLNVAEKHHQQWKAVGQHEVGNVVTEKNVVLVTFEHLICCIPLFVLKAAIYKVKEQ